MWSSLTFKKLTIKHGYLILYPKTFLFSLGIWCKGNTCFLNLQENVLPESSCLLQNATNYCYLTSVYVCGNIFVSIMCVFSSWNWMFFIVGYNFSMLYCCCSNKKYYLCICVMTLIKRIWNQKLFSFSFCSLLMLWGLMTVAFT